MVWASGLLCHAATIEGAPKSIVGRRPIRTKDGGRAACEDTASTDRIQDLIVDPAQTGGAYYVMQTLDQALLKPVEEALRAASRPQDFRLTVRAGGLPGTSI